MGNPFEVENDLKLKYSSTFTNIAGREYFEGDEYNIKNCFIEFITQYHQGNKNIIVDEENNGDVYHEVECVFKKYCEHCTRGTLSNNQSIIDNFCSHRCSTCMSLHKTQNRYHNQELCKQLLIDLSSETDSKKSTEVDSKKSTEVEKKKPKETVTITNKINININYPYIVTKDRYYYTVFTASGLTHDDQTNRLVYIFTVLMCGANGQQIFKNHTKHSNSEYYPVVGAIYTIRKDVGRPTLYGLLRYEHILTQSHKTAKQLTASNRQLYDNDTITTKIIQPLLWNDKKYHYDKTCLTELVQSITDYHYFGSELDVFYKND